MWIIGIGLKTSKPSMISVLLRKTKRGQRAYQTFKNRNPMEGFQLKFAQCSNHGILADLEILNWLKC